MCYIGLARGHCAPPSNPRRRAALSCRRAGGSAPRNPLPVRADGRAPHRESRRARVVGGARRPATVAAVVRGLAGPDTLPPARRRSLPVAGTLAILPLL